MRALVQTNLTYNLATQSFISGLGCLINTIKRIAWFVLSTLMHWIAIDPMDSIIQPSNKWDGIGEH